LGLKITLLHYIKNKIEEFNLKSNNKNQVMSKNRHLSQYQVPLRFDDAFFQDYAGNLIEDSNVAIIELVANCWDAGSKRVDIVWPEKDGGRFEILDDGHGMAKSKFESIWGNLKYNRRKDEGTIVEVTDIPNSKRKVYGRNGKGRHSLFCFSNTYSIETWREGIGIKYDVNKLVNSDKPYNIIYNGESPHSGHGTKISCNIERNYLPLDKVENLIGTKFIVNPNFEIYLNQKRVNLLDPLKNVTKKVECKIPGEGNVWINVVESTAGRLSTLHGVAWWVLDRPVGDHSWKDFDDTYLEYLDGRQNPAKRYTIIVQADILENEVLPDWTWFKETPRSKKIRQFIREFILDQIQELLNEVRSDTKVQILSKYRGDLKGLSPISRYNVGQFVTRIQKRCPSIRQTHLDHTVEIFTKMEQSRTGYDLLQQLAHFDVNDIDKLTEFLKCWSLNQAMTVLSELQWRLELIDDIEKMVNDPDADELHDLHPLFVQGRWIFGTEYESKEFYSNQTLNTIIKDKFKIKLDKNQRKRPDIVVFNDKSSLNILCNDRYDDNPESPEPVGLEKVLILELKQSKHIISDDDYHQAEAYGLTIRRSGNVDIKTRIIVYVLGKGTTLDKGEREGVEVIPKPYDIILRKAHARTFNLLNKIKQIKEIKDPIDPEVNAVLAQQDISNS
jgi:DNA mismatch repair enzyme (predicted ATPase)